MLSRDYADEICAVGRSAGLDRAGIASAAPFTSTRIALERRKSAGLAGSMQFTYRDPARSTEPERALAGAASLVVGARRYDSATSAPQGSIRVPGRVARYAADDNYAALRQGLQAVAVRLRSDGWSARVVLDDNALVDRAAAHRAALGWFGKNSNVLVPGIGSWVLLGSVLTTAPMPAADESVADGCGSCRRCLDACPTGAIVEAGLVDARLCLAWLVQARGVFPVEHRVALGDRLYGCDDCQEVCPPSRPRGPRMVRPPVANISEPLANGAESASAQAVRPARPDDSVDETGSGWVDVVELLNSPDSALLERFGRWYIPGREPRYLRRNALVVLANVGSPSDPEVRRVISDALRQPDSLVAAHAVWAARRLGLDDLVSAAVADRLLDVSDPVVLSELERDVVARPGLRGGR